MKYVVLGAGAIGGVVGARLFQAGRDVTLIALRAEGLRPESQGWVDCTRPRRRPTS